MIRPLSTALLAFALTGAAPEENGFREDARAIERLLADNYAFPERLPDGPLSPKLRAEAEAVTDKRMLARYAERALAALADHHAITGSSFADSWGLVPTHADLWAERRGGAFVITSVRRGSPAATAGIRPGDILESVGGVPTGEAVRAFWDDLGLPATGERIGYAARVLAAGRRNAPRRLGIVSGGRLRHVELPHLASLPRPERPPVSVEERGGVGVVRINDSLGDEATIAAFDAAMTRLQGRRRIAIDLSETPGGGNTVVARGILGWFVRGPTFYQVHSLPAEERRTGIARQWVEQVLPRAGKSYRGKVTVCVGRWTGSMGEGLGIAFDAIGADVQGDRMAGLLGAIYDHRLSHSGLVLKVPTERLAAVDGTPREKFVPKPAGTGTPCH